MGKLNLYYQSDASCGRGPEAVLRVLSNPVKVRLVTSGSRSVLMRLKGSAEADVAACVELHV